MAIGRTFPEALQKALRSLETGRYGLNADPGEIVQRELLDTDLWDRISVPSPDRLYEVGEALRRGMSVKDISVAT